MRLVERELLENLGDVSPLEYGGFFVFRYPDGKIHAEVVEPGEENANGEIENWKIYGFDLHQCTYENGILSDNPYHPNLPVWWADHLIDIPVYYCQENMTIEEVVTKFCSNDPLERAWVYRELFDIFGGEEFDSYPLTITDRQELENRLQIKKPPNPWVEYQTGSTIFKTFAEAAGQAVLNALQCGGSYNIDVVIWNEEGALQYGGDDAVARYREDPDSSVFERFRVSIQLEGRIP